MVYPVRGVAIASVSAGVAVVIAIRIWGLAVFNLEPLVHLYSLQLITRSKLAICTERYTLSRLLPSLVSQRV